jgi:hypothetical protein
MKRVLFGVLWFLVFWFGSLMVLGGAIGFMAAQHPQADGAPAQNFQQGYDQGYQAGQRMGRKYGWIPLLAALLLAVAGTATGKLPGTGRQE